MHMPRSLPASATDTAATAPAGRQMRSCGEPVEPGVAGTTATSAGEHLHNACVDEWIKS